MSKRYWSESEARRVLAAQARSGKSLAEYAREVGVDAKRLSRWRGRLARTTGPALLPVRVVEPLRPVEVIVGRHVVRVTGGFDREALRQVIAALESPC